MIRAVKPMEMLVLILKSHLFAWIFIFTTPQFVAKININPVQKIRRLAAVSSIYDGEPSRSARGMLKE